MSKRKNNAPDTQQDFFSFIPLSKDVSDAALEAEIYEDSGRRVYRDDHPVLLKWRESYFDEWLRQNPNGYCAKYSQERE